MSEEDESGSKAVLNVFNPTQSGCKEYILEGATIKDAQELSKFETICEVSDAVHVSNGELVTTDIAIATCWQIEGSTIHQE